LGGIQGRGSAGLAGGSASAGPAAGHAPLGTARRRPGTRWAHPRRAVPWGQGGERAHRRAGHAEARFSVWPDWLSLRCSRVNRHGRRAAHASRRA